MILGMDEVSLLCMKFHRNEFSIDEKNYEILVQVTETG